MSRKIFDKCEMRIICMPRHLKQSAVIILFFYLFKQKINAVLPLLGEEGTFWWVGAENPNPIGTLIFSWNWDETPLDPQPENPGDGFCVALDKALGKLIAQDCGSGGGIICEVYQEKDDPEPQGEPCPDVLLHNGFIDTGVGCFHFSGVVTGRNWMDDYCDTVSQGENVFQAKINTQEVRDF